MKPQKTSKRTKTSNAGTKAKPRKKMGRPTKYKPEFVEQAYKLCANGGFTDAQLADFFKVDISSVTHWKQKYPDFFTSIKNGKDFYDTENVESSLLKQATGYTVKEITESDVVIDGQVLEGVTQKKVVTKHVVVPTSTIFWLKNRNPRRWRDIKAMELSGPEGGPIETKGNINLSKLSDDELELLERITQHQED